MGAAHAAECRTIGTPVADAMAGLLEFYTVFHLAAEEVADGPVHDPCAVLAVTHPELFTFEGRPVHVELTCRVAYGVDADEVIALIMKAVREA